jgi:hypothetical protein
MNKFVKSAALTLCVLVGPAIAQTQAKPQQPAAPQQQAATRDAEPNTFANAALQIALAVDRDQAGALWDGASAITKRSTSREGFIGYVTSARKSTGAVLGRNWTVVRREQVNEGGQLPPGLYASIEFATRFQDNQARRELVSLRRDEDGTWRFSGYVVQ